MIIHVFITTGQIQKLNKNYKNFESKGVSGALHSLRILHIGRIVSGCNYKGKVLFLLEFYSYYCKPASCLRRLVGTDTQPTYCTENPADTHISSIIARFKNKETTVSCVLQYFHVGRLKQHVVLDTDQCSVTVGVKRGNKAGHLGNFTPTWVFWALSWNKTGLKLYLSVKNHLFHSYKF